MIKGRLCKFKINPGLYNPFKPSFDYYYNVHVFETLENMWEYSSKLRPYTEVNLRCPAQVFPLRIQKIVKGEWIYKPKIGDVLLCKNRLEAKIISHEAVHMSTHFLRILGQLNLNSEDIDDNEENLAYCIGNCTSEIYKKLYKSGVL